MKSKEEVNSEKLYKFVKTIPLQEMVIWEIVPSVKVIIPLRTKEDNQ